MQIVYPLSPGCWGQTLESPHALLPQSILLFQLLGQCRTCSMQRDKAPGEAAGGQRTSRKCIDGSSGSKRETCVERKIVQLAEIWVHMETDLFISLQL